MLQLINELPTQRALNWEGKPFGPCARERMSRWPIYILTLTGLVGKMQEAWVW